MSRTPRSGRQLGIAAGARLTATDLQKAIKSLYALGQFSDVRLDCVVEPGGRARLVVGVLENPLLGTLRVEGTSAVSDRTVRDRISLVTGMPVDPARVARARAAIDSVYEAKGFYLSEVSVDSTRQGGNLDLTFRIHEGGRLAISGVTIEGNQRVSDRRHRGCHEGEAGGLPLDRARARSTRRSSPPTWGSAFRRSTPAAASSTRWSPRTPSWWTARSARG